MYTDNTLHNAIICTMIDVYGQEKPHVYTCCGGGAIRGTSRGVRQRNEGKFRPAFTLFTNTNRKTFNIMQVQKKSSEHLLVMS